MYVVRKCLKYKHFIHCSFPSLLMPENKMYTSFGSRCQILARLCLYTLENESAMFTQKIKLLERRPQFDQVTASHTGQFHCWTRCCDSLSVLEPVKVVSYKFSNDSIPLLFIICISSCFNCKLLELNVWSTWILGILLKPLWCDVSIQVRLPFNLWMLHRSFSCHWVTFNVMFLCFVNATNHYVNMPT